MNYQALLQDVLARIVAAREACDPFEREAILAGLEQDVVAALDAESREAA